ncbi:BrnA antitoxin family protein [Pasteurellaceae bacterium TAE3-ERU1]|nr:BrnA antitoxin family protein [Pasteurellaceae bacterium TAE3-ERU1]
MKKEYDFTNAVSNPYAQKLKGKSKKVVTIRLDDDAIDYFKTLSEKVNLPYQTLINLYLKDCAEKKRTLSVNWQ